MLESVKASRRGFLGLIVGGAVAPYVPAVEFVGLAPKVAPERPPLVASGLHRVRVRTGLPSAKWRKFNEGVRPLSFST